MKEITLYTDGGCQGNPGPGGWGVVLLHRTPAKVNRKEMSGSEPATTNNRMELSAAIAGLRALRVPCKIQLFTDSEYVKNGITKWIAGWKKNGWRTKDRSPVKNADLWQVLDLSVQIHQIDWQWVKGHAGVPENERCDVLATTAIEKVKKLFTREELAEQKRAFLVKMARMESVTSHGKDTEQGSLPGL